MKLTKEIQAPPSGPLTDDEEALYRRLPESVDYVDNEVFASSDVESRFFGEAAGDVDIPAWTTFPEVPEDTRTFKTKSKTLTKKDEIELFLRYNYARYRLAELLAATGRSRSTARARRKLLWFKRLLKVRSDIVGANLALVLAMAKRTRIPNVDFAELISEGNMALLRSVEKFDVARGFKFSTYACRAILKSFNRLATNTGRYRKHFPREFEPQLERSDYDVSRHEIRQEESVDALRDILIENQANLTDVERTVVMERFAIGSWGKGRTLSEVGQIVGLTNERVRQIQNLALGKIRAALDEEYLAA